MRITITLKDSENLNNVVIQREEDENVDCLLDVFIVALKAYTFHEETINNAILELADEIIEEK